jgi:hypothetical protein
VPNERHINGSQLGSVLGSQESLSGVVEERFDTGERSLKGLLAHLPVRFDELTLALVGHCYEAFRRSVIAR